MVSVKNVRTFAAAAIMAYAIVSRISSSSAPACFAPAKWFSAQWRHPAAALALKSTSSRVLASSDPSTYSKRMKAETFLESLPISPSLFLWDRRFQSKRHSCTDSQNYNKIQVCLRAREIKKAGHDHTIVPGVKCLKRCRFLYAPLHMPRHFFAHGFSAKPIPMFVKKPSATPKTSHVRGGHQKADRR